MYPNFPMDQDTVEEIRCSFTVANRGDRHKKKNYTSLENYKIIKFIAPLRI